MDIDNEIKVHENYIDFRNMIQTYDIPDIFEFFKDQRNVRYLSGPIYLAVRQLNILYQEIFNISQAYWW